MSGEKPAPRSAPTFGHRRLTTDEEHLWSLVARSIKPLRQGKKPVAAVRYKGVPPDTARSAKKRIAVDPAIPGPRQLPASTKLPIPIVRRERQQLARGRVAIDALIDLHGMTQAQAHSALRQFLHRSQAHRAKFVLVITGKGAPNAPRGGRGVLRHQVPIWLALPEFRGYVLAFDVAHVGHGGEGALYVRLRKAGG